MVEKFLADLFRVRQKQKVAIIIDGGIVSEALLGSLSTLVERLREVGEIKIAEVISDVKLTENEYESLRAAGFNDKVVPGNLELNLLLETYDLVLTDKSIDIIVLGTDRTSLIPLYTEIRKQLTVYAFVSNNNLPKSFEECFDGVIFLDKMDEFNFHSSDFSEFDVRTGSLNGSKGEFTIDEESEVDEANIGITSEDFSEQSELEEELKDTNGKKISQIKKQEKKIKAKTRKTVKSRKTDDQFELEDPKLIDKKKVKEILTKDKTKPLSKKTNAKRLPTEKEVKEIRRVKKIKTAKTEESSLMSKKQKTKAKTKSKEVVSKVKETPIKSKKKKSKSKSKVLKKADVKSKPITEKKRKQSTNSKNIPE